MSLSQLPREMLLKVISDVEHEYKEKYLETKRELDMMKTCFDYRTKRIKCGNSSCKEFCFYHDTNMDGDSDDNGLDKLTIVVSYKPNEYTFADHITLNSDDNSYHTLTNAHNLYGSFCSYGCEQWFCNNHWEENSVFNKKTKLENISRFCKQCVYNSDYFFKNGSKIFEEAILDDD